MHEDGRGGTSGGNFQAFTGGVDPLTRAERAAAWAQNYDPVPLPPAHLRLAKGNSTLERTADAIVQELAQTRRDLRICAHAQSQALQRAADQDERRVEL